MTEDDKPPNEPEKPKRLSFRVANLGPEHQPEPPVKPQSFFSKRKRSVSVGLLATGAAAAAIYGFSQRNTDCDWLPPEQQASCRQSGGHGGGAHFFSGSSGSSSSSSSDAHSASRGGFGGSGSAHGGSGE